jgi:DNA integrity scanning protein DisA with diadenylate cyclase activity
MENSGTGTRAALAASKEMPNSLVVKVSASGKLMVYKNGNSLDT